MKEDSIVNKFFNITIVLFGSLLLYASFEVENSPLYQFQKATLLFFGTYFVWVAISKIQNKYFSKILGISKILFVIAGAISFISMTVPNQFSLVQSRYNELNQSLDNEIRDVHEFTKEMVEKYCPDFGKLHSDFRRKMLSNPTYKALPRL